ncbi:MAG TPA: HlyD family efflux transporter periplasmic adaptor subunit [Gemmataceae bacterium]|jgi:membrane fusion protein, multidrug efflux system|nr:HlyD family efflux transporter periplasmic adaptor subunit [Gemmataceae bacterium]
MKSSTRWSRLPWLLGLALLTGSLLGAGHVLHSRPNDSTGGGSRGDKTPVERQPYANGQGVYCHGTVDVESVYTNHALSPVQAGRVVEILTAESLAVRAGDVLLRVDDEQILEKAAQAEILVTIAESQLQEARQARDRYPALLAAQQSVVDAAQEKVKAGESRLRRARRLLEEQQAGNADEVAALEHELNAGRKAAKAEEDKLRELQASKPDPKIEQAEKNVELRKSQLREARAALNNCKLVAPADGTILRLNVALGSVVGPQMQRPPVEFVPAEPRLVRATVEQEFAHRVHLDQPAVIEDEVNSAITWTGKVKRLADAFLPRRSVGNALSLANGSDTQYLEFLVDLNPSPNPPKLGQRVRVSLGTRN